jgi:hypothetical protein
MSGIGMNKILDSRESTMRRKASIESDCMWMSVLQAHLNRGNSNVSLENALRWP